MADDGKGKVPAALMDGRQRVLVVDDSPDALRYLMDAIEASDATVLVALSGEDALEIAGRAMPDVVLMDAVMPGIGGFEAIRRFKRDPRLRDLPVIVMTGLSETEHVVEGLQAGAVDYLAKPIVPDELLARIRVHLARARETEAVRSALDLAGRSLVAADDGYALLWMTPQARELLSQAFGAQVPTHLPAETCDALRRDKPSAIRPLPKGWGAAGRPLELAYAGRLGEGENLFRIMADQSETLAERLRERFQLTVREAEVSLWLSRGKSNRDIAEILDLSPRTVNKHLETVFVKLGVENRAAAAVLISSLPE